MRVAFLNGMCVVNNSVSLQSKHYTTFDMNWIGTLLGSSSSDSTCLK